MSAQLGVGLNGQGLSQAKSRSRGKRSRQLSLNVRAQERETSPIGTAFLKALPFGTGTLSLKPNKGGTSFLQSLTGGVSKAQGAPDAKTVFVAGATGRTGARVVRELLKAGFKVRAGARDTDVAQQALDVAETYGLLSAQEAKQVTLVAVDFAKPESIRAAIGGARKVVCALGAAESDALNFANVKKVDGDFTTGLVNAAASAGVEQFVLVSSLGTGKVGWPASVLNLFGGVLIWKRESEKALEASGMAYTIVRPGGMERPTDAYKKTHNVVLSRRDTQFGGQVSRLQVAELVGTILINPELSENKVVEVTAETTAPRMTYQELLAGIKPDLTRETQLELKAAGAAARETLEEAEEKAQAARAALAAADGRVKELADRLKAAKGQESEVKAKVAPVLKDGASAEKALEAARAAADKAALQEAAAKAVFEAAKKAASQGQLLDKKQLKAVADQVLNPPPAPKAQPALAVAAAGASAASAPKPFFSFLVPAAPAAQKEASPEPPAVAPKAAPKAAPAKSEEKSRSPSPFASFGSFLGMQEAVQLDANTAAVKVPAKDATPPPAPVPVARAAPKVAPKEPTPPPAPKPAAPAPVAAKPAPAAAPAAPAKSPEPQPLFAGFGNMFNFGTAISADEIKKVEVPPKQESPAPAAPAKPAVVAAAAPPAAPPAPVAAPVARAAPAAPPKPSVPVEDPREVERRALAALAEERRAKALAEAKVRLEKENAAVEAAKAISLKASQQKAPSPPPRSPSPPPPAKAAAAPAAPAKAAAPADPSAASVEAEKKAAQAWIAAWQKKQAAAKAAPAAAAPASSNGASAAPPKAGPAYDEASAVKSKAEAKAWIAAWQAKKLVSAKQ